MKRRFTMKNLLSAIIVIALLVTVFGCSNNSSDKKSQPDTSSKIDENKPASNNTGKKVKLTVVTMPNVESFLPGENENKNSIIDFLEKESGFDLEWVILPSDQTVEKLNTLMASGDPPDVINFASKDVFGNYLQQGALAPLDQYLSNCPNINKLVPQDVWAPVTWEGKRYAVPVPQNQEASAGIFVREDWLGELNLKTPETIDDYYNVMKQFKDKKKVIPFTATASGGVIGGFAGAFGIGTAYKVKNNQIVYSLVQPEAKDYLIYMNKLFKEGLLDQEFLVNKNANVQEKLVSGQAAMTVAGWPDALPIDRAFKEKNPSGKLAYIAPPKGKDGQWGFSKYPPLRTYLMVPAQSNNIKEAVQFIDFMARPDVYNFVSFGEKGKHYVEENGEIKLTEEYQKRRWQIYYILIDTKEAFQVRLRDKGFKPYYDATKPFAVLEPIDQYAPPFKEVTSINADLGQLVEEYFIKFITGDLSFDNFDEFVQQWKAKGGEKAVERLNKWYKEEYKK